jgi:hypothetical protein
VPEGPDSRPSLILAATKKPYQVTVAFYYLTGTRCHETWLKLSIRVQGGADAPQRPGSGALTSLRRAAPTPAAHKKAPFWHRAESSTQRPKALRFAVIERLAFPSAVQSPHTKLGVKVVFGRAFVRGTLDMPSRLA